MGIIGQAIGAVVRAFARAARWGFESVEDDQVRNVIPMPGPAHGPIPAIDVRLERQRRKAS